jgi:Domain of unknown function (DUF4824)
MKHAGALAAAAIVLLANAFAMIHAAINRAGQPEAEIVLTERELNYSPSSDDSGVSVNLRWVDPGATPYSSAWDTEELEARTLLNQAKLEELGFDCRVAPSDPKADTFYSRPDARTGFVALEYDGAAWQSWMERRERNERAVAGTRRPVDYERISGSRLVVIDAGADAAALRARHPERDRVLILPAVIRMSLTPRWPSTLGRPARPARLSGYIQEIPSEIHVPRPFSDRLRELSQGGPRAYRVRLRYGRLLEPWVTGVE